MDHIYNEAELLQRVAEGDETAMTILYNVYAKGLLNAAFNVLRDKETAEDILQEVFLSLWLQREKLMISSSLKSYLYSAVRYQVFRAIRKGKVTTLLLEEAEERMWGESTTENLLYQKDMQIRINKVVDKLPKKCKEIYRLSREEHLSHREIAQRLNITTKAVEFQISVALKRIRQALTLMTGFIVFWLNQK